MMNINIKTTNIELTPEISDYLNKKISSFKKFVGEKDTGAFLSIEIGKSTKHHKSGSLFFTEINFRIGNEDFRTREQDTESLISSIDKAKDMALENLRASKDRKINR